jgi:cytochrome c oxidase cbb3-type subunit 4
MDINVMREIVTVASFLAFAGVVAYALTPRNKQRFEEAARLPLDDEPPCVGGQEGR